MVCELLSGERGGDQQRNRKEKKKKLIVCGENSTKIKVCYVVRIGGR